MLSLKDVLVVEPSCPCDINNGLTIILYKKTSDVYVILKPSGVLPGAIAAAAHIHLLQKINPLNIPQLLETASKF